MHKMGGGLYELKERGHMRSANDFLPKFEIVPIPLNCSASPSLVRPVQDLAELLAEIAARRLKKQNPSAPCELENKHG